MEPERWQKVEQLYHAALERGESERAAFLEEACGGDEGLRHEVKSLLVYQSCQTLASLGVDWPQISPMGMGGNNCRGPFSTYHPPGSQSTALLRP